MWMAVLAAGVKSVKMGADTELLVADLVPALHLKAKGSAPYPRNMINRCIQENALKALL